MASNRGRHSLTAPGRSYPSSSPSTATSPPTSKTFSSQQQQQQRPRRRDPIIITKGAGTSSMSSSISSATATSSSTSSSFSSSSSSYTSSTLSQQQYHNEVPSAFRRSMSPIGGAANAMRNFLRRKRGNTSDGNNNQITAGGDMEAVSPHDQAPLSQHQQHRVQQQQQQQRPSLTMQSFVLVGGVDFTTTTTPTTIYDIDAGSFSDSESVSASRCQSPVSGSLPSSITNLSTSSPSATTSTFSQAMKSRFGRDRTPTRPSTPTPGTPTGTGTPTVLSPSSSFRRSRSRNPSAPATETLAHDTATGTTSVTGGGALLASMRKKLNRRSLSADSVPIPSSSKPSTPSSLPRPHKTTGQAQAQAQKLALANAQGGAGREKRGAGGGGGDISIGMSMHFSGSTVGGSVLRPPNNSNSIKYKNSGGKGAAGGRETVAFQDARNEVSGGSALAISRQQGANSGNNNTEKSGGRNNKNNNGVDDDDLDALDISGDSTLRSSDLSSQSLDPADISTTAADNLDDDSEKQQQLSDRLYQRQQKVNRLKLQQNSIEFLSAERARTRPRDGVPSVMSKKTLRRRSDSTLFSSITVNGSSVALDTSLALEDLEKEIRALKTNGALLHPILTTVGHLKTEPSTCELPGKGRLVVPPRREAKIMLVSSSALPTQFYDATKTRNVLRTYLTSPGLEFDEMIEYGFPSEAFMDDGDLDDNNGDHLASENSLRLKASAAELAPSCRFLTLRITLTPWHARADESTLYGPRNTVGRQLQFKAMVNRFFSRSGSTTTAAPLMSPSPPVALVGGIASPKINSQRLANTLPTSVSLSALDAAAAGGPVTPVSSPRPPNRAVTTGRRTPSGSRVNSRASSPGRDRPNPSSSQRASPAATEHCGSNVITPLLPSHIQSPNYVSSRAIPTTTTITTAEGEHSTPRIGRRLFSPTPSSSSSHSMIPLPVGTGSSSQPPRKGSLSALSLPLGSQQQQTPAFASSSFTTHAPMVPPRRKGSSPALFFTSPPSSPSNHGLRSATSTGGREVYPSPSSRAAALTYGFSPPPRRPSDQSDSISASLASARGLNTSGTGGQYIHYVDTTLDGRPLRDKADTEPHAHNQRQNPLRYPHSIHIKQQQQTASSSPPSPSSFSSSGSRSRQGSHSRLPVFDHSNHIQQPQSISLPFSEQGSEEQIFECYHVVGLDNIYRNNNKTSRQPPSTTSSAVEKRIHPLQAVSQQQQQQLPMRQGTKASHFSSRREGGGKGDYDESHGGMLASSAMSSGDSLVAVEQTPLSAAPPRIQAKNQRRPGGFIGPTVSRTRPVGSTERVPHRQNYTTIARREEDEMDECEVHVGDISFVDGLEDLDDDEEQQQGEREAVAAAGIGGCWRPIACHQTSTMKTFAFP
ncbi:hypothetical protein BGZ96_000942 [Linnemannia gamsii]|uniref:Uncharacterized protein n=1 Tax=Linnemannia gamsii TaxID=64522 RepID=A0ABQ7JN31_9FUNG|nr:hypothetical protein BGZ96_000942 [Linnemannia gamsii]